MTRTAIREKFRCNTTAVKNSYTRWKAQRTVSMVVEEKPAQASTPPVANAAPQAFPAPPLAKACIPNLYSIIEQLTLRELRGYTPRQQAALMEFLAATEEAA